VTLGTKWNNMCLYPKLIKNPKYTANKKNGGVIPAISDTRVATVPIGCGRCIECMKKKANEWKVRLLEDIRHNKNGKFITLTFSNESIRKLVKKIQGAEGYTMDNAIATLAVKLFRERWRKHYGKSIRHWLVTELGHNGTENIHLHGIIWTDESYDTIKKHWQYGHIYPTKDSQKTWVNDMTVNYIVKYVSKIDRNHKNYKPITLTSPGIGKEYIVSYNSRTNIFNEELTNDTYRTKTGAKIALPIYYRNKLYSEEEREKLWLHRLDKNERWVLGMKIKADDDEEYKRIINHAREINTKLGYGDDTKNYNQIKYENELRKLRLLERIKGTKRRK